jgi:thermitase
VDRSAPAQRFRHGRLVLTAACVLAVAATGSGANAAQMTRVSAGAAADSVPRQVLVRFDPGTTSAEASQALSAASVVQLKSLLLERTRLATVRGSQTVSGAIAVLQHNPHVMYAEPNWLMQPASTPNDPLFPKQWALGSGTGNIDVQPVWNSTTGNAAVRVGIADTGVDAAHPDIAPNVVAGRNFVTGAPDPTDTSDSVWHGTFIAGVIGAVGNNALGVAGTSWAVSMAPLKICDLKNVSNAVPPVQCTVADFANAVVYASQNGIAVVNDSLNTSRSSRTVHDAIAAASNVLVVTAAGNAHKNIDSSPIYPCSYTDLANIVCVAATDQTDHLASFSSYGPNTVDIAAPGTSIWSVYPWATKLSDNTFAASGWTTGGTNNQWHQACPTSNCFLASTTGSAYSNNTDSWAQTAQPVSLAAGNHCQAQFKLKGAVASGDHLLVEGATSTAGPWTQVASWSGSLSKATTATYPMAAFDGQPAVYLRFELVTDGSGTATGPTIDNLVLQCQPDAGAYTSSQYTSSKGTSFATAYVTGAVALLEAARPGATIAQIQAALLAGAHADPNLLGFVAGQRRLDVAGSLAQLPASAAVRLAR